MTSLTLLEVDPRTLVVIDQVRHDATPDDALVVSVREHGIIEPPTVARTEDDQLVIVTGHRRIGAAILAGLETISVVERTIADAGERLAVQIVENERRRQLDVQEVAGGFQQLTELFGLTPDDIAAAVGETPDRVRAGLAVAKSKDTAKAITEHPAIDLERAALIAEFDGHPKLQQQLVDVALERPRNFEYSVELYRKQVALEEEIAKRVANLKAKGTTVIKVRDYDYYRGDNDKGTALENLTDPDGNKITVTAHRKCPGHVAWLSGTWSIDALKTNYGCSDWHGNGHLRPNIVARVKTEDELRAEQEYAELQQRVEANRTARRQWIHDLLPGKINQLPGVYEYMAAALLNASQYYGADHRYPLIALPLLDAPEQKNDRDATAEYNELAASKRVAPFRLMLATAFAVHENRCARAYGEDAPMIVQHFTFLEKWGYTLSDLDTASRDAAADALAAAAERRKTSILPRTADAAAETTDQAEETDQ